MSNFITFLSIALLVYLAIRSNKNTTSSTSQAEADNMTKFEEDQHMSNPDDLFLHSLSNRINEIDKTVEDAEKNREKELENKYSRDLELQQKLINFAKQYKLGEALIDIWEEIKHYPSWVNNHNYEKKINISDIELLEEGKIKKISFSFGGAVYAISRSSERSYVPDDYNNYSTFTLYEDNQDVFIITAEEDYAYDCLRYGTPYIKRLIKKEKWINLLIEGSGEIKIAKAVQHVDFKYYSADKIKINFEE